MKKLIITELILCLSLSTVLNVQGQESITGNPAEDAVTFKNYISSNKQQELFALIGFYFNVPNVNASTADSLLRTNRFLKKYADVVNKLASGSPAATPTGGGSASFGLSTIIADGAAQFLIERGKQELSMAFFDRFKKDLKKYPELTYLFPRTTDIVNPMENHNITTLLQELRDAFIKDLLRTPENILSLREIDKAKCGGNTACETRVGSIVTFFQSPGGKDQRLIIAPLMIMQGLIDGDNILELTDKLIADKSTCSNKDLFSGYLQFISVMLQSFKSSQERDGLFISSSALKNLFSSDDLLNIFLGLALEKYRNRNCYKNLEINGKKLEDLLLTVQGAQTQALNAFSLITKINTHFLSIKKQIEGGKTIERTSFASLVTFTIKSFSEIIIWVEEEMSLPLPPDFDKFKKYLSIASDICVDIQQNNYAGIFNGAISFINEVGLFDDNARAKAIKYLAFGANLASAKSSAEVKEAINSVALPPGSYSIKQKSFFNISVNGYIGYAWDYGKVDDKSGVYAKGVSAPIGFSASWGIHKKYGGAITIFTSVIDLGAVVSYRLKNGNTDELKQEIRLESIISPSVQLLLAVPKFPIAFGPSYRRTPKLFYTDDNNFTVIKPKDVFNFSILIDIPIFTIKNSPYK